MDVKIEITPVYEKRT